jgi:hypothetical protein
MYHKYFDQYFPAYFEFGVYPATGNVDLSDGNDDVHTNVTPAEAEQLMEAREVYRADLWQKLQLPGDDYDYERMVALSRL